MSGLAIVRHKPAKIEVYRRRVFKPDPRIQFHAFAIFQDREFVSTCRKADVPVASIAVRLCLESLVESDPNYNDGHSGQRFSISVDDLSADASRLRIHTRSKSHEEKDYRERSHLSERVFRL